MHISFVQRLPCINTTVVHATLDNETFERDDLPPSLFILSWVSLSLRAIAVAVCRKCVAIFDRARFSINRRARIHRRGCGAVANQRVGGWILARREGVGAVRRSGDQGCIHIHSLPVSLSLSFSPFSAHPFAVSYPLSLSPQRRLLSGAPRRAVSASSASASSRRSSLSLVSPSTLSVASAASRRYDALRRPSYPGRDAAVNFPTIYTSDTDLAIDNNRNRRCNKTSTSFFFSRIVTSKVFPFDLHGRRKGAETSR